MKKILGIILILISSLSYSQYGWQSGSYYAYEGQTTKECGNSYALTIAYYDDFGYAHYNYYRDCQVLKWERQYYSGYVNVWGPNGWYTEYKEGYYWYCWWSPVFREFIGVY